MCIRDRTDPVHGVVSDLSGICAVGHRIVHGGEKFSESVLITDEVMEAIKENIELAPLHNPANLMGIDACRALMPDVPMVGVFDTAFHANMPKKLSLIHIYPPYTSGFYKPAMEGLVEYGLLSNGAIIVAESNAPLEIEFAGYMVEKQKKYGKTFLNFFRWKEG